MRTPSTFAPDDDLPGVSPEDIRNQCIENRHIGAGEITPDKLDPTTASPLVAIRIDGDGGVIADGLKTPPIVIPATMSPFKWKLVAFDAAGALVADTFTVDLLVSTAWNVAPVSITGTGTKPALAAVSNNSGAVLTGYTKTALGRGQLATVQISGTPATAYSAVLTLEQA